MHNAKPMRMGKTVQHLIYNLNRARLVESADRQQLVQGVPVHELHDHEKLIADAQGGSQRCDVRMLEPGNYSDLAEKALDELRAGIEVRKQHLHGFGAVRN